MTYIVCWDSSGESLNNFEFSKFFERSMLENMKLYFVIGGSFGIPRDILDKSNKTISISSFTLPHRLFKIVLIEQIYRSFSILKNLPYHKWLIWMRGLLKKEAFSIDCCLYIFSLGPCFYSCFSKPILYRFLAILTMN